MIRLPHVLLIAAAPMALAGCRFEAAGPGTPTPGVTGDPIAGSPTPGYAADPSEDDDLTIESVVPVDGAAYLPSAFQIVATFSEPYLGIDGDIIGRFGPTCEAGVVLRPQISDDRTQVTWNMSAQPGEDYCFDLTVLSNLNDPPHVASEWSIAECGVSFDSGRGTRFESIGEDTEIVGPINQALANFYFPTQFAFPGLDRTTTFPTTTEITFGRLLQVYAGEEGSAEPTGAWSVDPNSGAADVLRGCRIDSAGGGWDLTCATPELLMPINLDIGAVLEDGTVLDPGDGLEVGIVGAQITAKVSDSGAFGQLSELEVQGAMSEADLLAIFGSDGDALESELQRLDKNADTDNDGTNDGYTLVLTSEPVWIPIMGCDPSLY